MNLRDFLRSHPAVIGSIEAFEHAGLDGAEDVLLAAVGAHLGIFSKLLPLQTIADGLKAMAERGIDGALDALQAPPPAPAITFSSPAAAPAPAPAPVAVSTSQTDPRTRAAQASRAAQLATVQNPEAAKDAENAQAAG